MTGWMANSAKPSRKPTNPQRNEAPPVVVPGVLSICAPSEHRTNWSDLRVPSTESRTKNISSSTSVIKVTEIRQVSTKLLLPKKPRNLGAACASLVAGLRLGGCSRWLPTRALQGKQGGDKKSDQIKLDNIQLVKAPTGTSESAALRRLRKDRPDLLEVWCARRAV